MKKLGGIIVGVSPIVLVLAVVLAIGLIPQAIIESIRSIFNNNSATVTTSETLITGIQPLGQLTSVRTQLAKANIGVNMEFGAANICKVYTKYVAQANVEAGIDLTKLTEASVQYDKENNTYTVLLPAPQLTGCYLDPMQTQEYNRLGETPVCTINADEARRLASYTALTEFRNDALESGILDRAKREADLVLTNFIGVVTGSQVKIEFEENTMPFPQSCQPEPPDGWILNTEQNFWYKP
jgi:hypothetical protein